MITTKDLNSITEILARNKYKDHVDLLNDFQDVKQIEKALNKNQLELF
jgi:hypothetical protein